MLPNDEAQLKAEGYEFARGTRNSYDPAFAPNGDLISADNGPDADYPDELNWLQEGHHYGFPWRLGNFDNPQQFASYNPTSDGRLPPEFFAIKSGFYYTDLTFPRPPQGVTFTDPIPNLGPDANIIRSADGSEYRASDAGEPAYSFTPHRSALGLNFDTAGALGGELKGDAFILSWGAAAGNISDKGRDLLHIELTKTGGQYRAKMTQLVVGFDYPVDGALLGNKMYVLDYGGKGSIWEITLP
jgi:glucose/arabinose dehydrogenase